MSVINIAPAEQVASKVVPIEKHDETKVRQAIYGEEPSVLTNIYDEQNNIVIWQRDLADKLNSTVDDFLASKSMFQSSMTVTPESAMASISEALGTNINPVMAENMAELVAMFALLFDLKRVGLRMEVLSRAMCPRFHVDKVPCRLVTTYRGVATEWLEHQSVNREKLGAGNNGLPDNLSGLYQNDSDIQQLTCGDVALLKGEMWAGNENAGLVHRSPLLPDGESRLLLTLDFSS